MKSWSFFAILFLSLLSVSPLSHADAYEEAYAERIKSAKSFARARILVAGLTRNKALSRKVYQSAIGKIENKMIETTTHLSRARELLLKGFHNGDIDKASSDKLKDLLKRQKLEIAQLRSSIDELHARFAERKYVAPPDQGP